MPTRRPILALSLFLTLFAAFAVRVWIEESIVRAAPLVTASGRQISNVSNVAVTVSWLTDSATTGQVRYGTTSALGSVAQDDRGSVVSADTHHVTIGDLMPSTLYYYDLMMANGAAVDNNGGAHYTFRTAPTLDLPPVDNIYGQVMRTDGVTPAEGAIVYLYVKDGDVNGSAGQSALLSSLVDANGYWYISLTRALLPDQSGFFQYSASGDRVHLSAQGGTQGVKEVEVDTANDAPAATMVLEMIPPTNTPTFTPVPPTNTPTFTPVPPTNTPTFTPVPPTNTPTFTPVPPTNTPTFTPVPPTNTPTYTPVPPTNTPTFTPVPPTNTPTFTPTPPTNTPTFTPTPPTSPGSKTKSFQNGAAPNANYTGAIDAYVSEAQSTTNFGTAVSLIVSGSDPSGTGKDKWALLKWNLSTITGIVQSASLTLNITDHSGGQTYELYEAVATWSETAVKWSAKPAKGTTLLGTVRATANGSLTASLNTAGVAVVQKWLNTPSKNYGFYLLQSANTDTMAFDSREKTTATLRPKLTVTYKPPVITSGPTVSGITATTATVVWETDTYAKSKIKYRKQGTATWTTKSVTTKLTSGKWVATASLTGLTANTTYEYQVQASVDSPLTPTRTFRTLAAGPAGLELPAAPGEDTIWPSLYIPLFLNQ